MKSEKHATFFARIRTGGRDTEVITIPARIVRGLKLKEYDCVLVRVKGINLDRLK